MRMILTVAAAVAVAMGSVGGVGATPIRVPSNTAVTVSGAGQTKSLAGHRWRYQAQVDGVGGLDRIVIVGSKDLHLNDIGGSGHITVSVRLAGTRRVASKRLDLSDYYSPQKHWTPWYGATQLDHGFGKELLIGSTSGAHTQVFTALTYRDGKLRKLGAPGGKYASWGVNSSYGTGNEGWRCTSDGVESRAVYPNNIHRRRFHIVRDKYAYRSGRWSRTGHYATTVAANNHGNPPTYTDNYFRFACPGLPNAF